MNDLILYAALGLGAGALIASIALGIVLIYRGSGVINLAVGALAMTGAYIFWSFRSDYWGFTLSTVPAYVLTLVCMAVLGVIVELSIFRPLRNASPVAKLAASLGLLLVLQAGAILVFGNTPKSAPSVLPTEVFTLLDRVVPKDRFILAGIVILVAAALAALYRWTLFGLSTRAASENEVSAMLAGLSPSRLAVVNMVLASVVAGGLGILVAPLITLDAQTLAFLVVPALGAALLAGFTSFGIACFAGIALGVAQSLITTYWSNQSWFPTDSGGGPVRGVYELFVFLVIVLAMFLRGANLPGRGELVEKRLPVVPRPERLLRPSVIAAVAGAVALIVFPYDFRQALINSLLGVIICLSLVVIVGFVGQISVMQLALAGVAGFTMSHLTTDAGGVWAEFPISLLVGASVATVVGLLVAVSALRVRGVSLAVVTLAAAVAIEQFGFANARWGGGDRGSPVDTPNIGGLDLGPHNSFRGVGGLPSPVFGFLVLAATILLGLLVANVRRASLGQRMLAVRSNERAAAAAGIDVRNTKLAGFGIAAFVAGMAGALYAYNFGSVSSSRFGAVSALGLIAFAYFGGITMVSGAVIAGLGSTEALFPHALDKWFGLSGNWALLIGGFALIITLIVNPEGIAGTGWKKQQEKKRRRAAEGGAPPGPGALISRLRRPGTTTAASGGGR